MCLSSNGANQLFVYLTAPRVLAHMPAWSASLITQVRTLPASLEYKCVCVCVWIGGWACERMSVHVHLLQSRCIVWQITPDLSPRGGSVLMYMWIALVTNYRCSMCSYASAYDHVQVFVLAWGPICLHLSFEEMPDSRPVKAPFPLLLPVIFFGTRWGARVTSDPLLHCDWRDRPDSPPPCYCTLMGIWHYSDPFINRATTMHLSFPSSLISVPISVIL